jgi:hypothetical protein
MVAGATAGLLERRATGPIEGADFVINLVRPTPEGALPMRRIFEDVQGNELEQLDLWKYGYDPRKRFWYNDTIKAERPLISSPYLAFTISAPVITISAPLKGRVQGVLAGDLPHVPYPVAARLTGSRPTKPVLGCDCRRKSTPRRRHTARFTPLAGTCRFMSLSTRLSPDVARHTSCSSAKNHLHRTRPQRSRQQRRQ